MVSYFYAFTVSTITSEQYSTECSYDIIMLLCYKGRAISLIQQWLEMGQSRIVRVSNQTCLEQILNFPWSHAILKKEKKLLLKSSKSVPAEVQQKNAATLE